VRLDPSAGDRRSGLGHLVKRTQEWPRMAWYWSQGCQAR
jgi:hypothetical protein